MITLCFDLKVVFEIIDENNKDYAMRKFLLFLRGCVLGIALFGLVIGSSDAGIMGERSSTFLVGSIIGILLIGYASMKFPGEFWKGWFPKSEIT